MKRQSLLRKLLALVLVFVLSASLALPVFAAEGENGYENGYEYENEEAEANEDAEDAEDADAEEAEDEDAEAEAEDAEVEDEEDADAEEEPEYVDEPEEAEEPEEAYELTVEVDGVEVVFPDQGPIMVDGTVLVPVRGVFEMLGFTPEWNRVERVATLTRAGLVIVIPAEGTTFTVNGEVFTPSAPQRIMNDRLMLPLRSIAEAIGATPNWIPATQTAQILTDAVTQEPEPAEEPAEEEEYEPVEEPADEDEDEEEPADEDEEPANEDEENDEPVAGDFDVTLLVGVWEADTDVLEYWWAYKFNADFTAAWLNPPVGSSVFDWAYEDGMLLLIGDRTLYFDFELEGDVLVLTEIIENGDDARTWTLVRLETRSWLGFDELVGYWEWFEDFFNWEGYEFYEDGTGAFFSTFAFAVWFHWFVDGDNLVITGPFNTLDVYVSIDGDTITFYNRDNPEYYMVLDRVDD